MAERLGIPSVKAHRLIARAVADGVVKVSIDGDIVECIDLEGRLCARFGLGYCEVAPDLGEDGLPLRSLGLAGASYLRREIDRGAHKVIGLGHGRTLAAAVQQLPRLDAKGIRFVSLLGGLTRNYAANPYDVMHRLAERTAAQAYVMPVPFFANSVDDREVLLDQRGVREVFEMAEAASLKLVGIGTVEPNAQLVSSGMIEPGEIEEIMAGGGVGELLGPLLRRGRPDDGDDAHRPDAGGRARRGGVELDGRDRRRRREDRSDLRRADERPPDRAHYRRGHRAGRCSAKPEEAGGSADRHAAVADDQGTGRRSACGGCRRRGLRFAR